MSGPAKLKPVKPAPPKVEILDHAPVSIRRPLTLLNGHAYGAAWLDVKITMTETMNNGKVVKHRTPKEVTERAVFIVRNDGVAFSDHPGEYFESITNLGANVVLPEIPRPDRRWSPKGVQKYLAGDRPDPKDVFNRVTGVIDRFIDFERSLADQRQMTELIACYILATWFLDAFNVIGYLWPTGERGSGKTRLLAVVAEMAYLGELILAGSSYATLRDLADYGATLAFDDAENISDPKHTDPDKRTLLLAGNRRGATVTLKEPTGKGKWRTRRVQTFCPRLFSAINLPDPVLSSRSITIPLIRTPDREKSNTDPLDYELWPHDRQYLVDDLWALGLSHLLELHKYEKVVNQRSRLTGRNLEPWRPILAVALWLEKNGVSGLWERMEALSWKYHTEEKPTLETADWTHLTIRALIACAISANKANSAVRPEWFFTTEQITNRVLGIVRQEEIDIKIERITTRKVGRTLGSMRFKKHRPDGSGPRGWLVTRTELERHCQSYVIAFPNELRDSGMQAVSFHIL